MKIALGEKLGGGCFGDVYRGIDEMGRTVAVKIIRPDDAAGELARAHATLLAKVDHANIVRVFSIEQVIDPDDPSREVTGVVMELIEGPTLTQHLNASVLTLDDAREIGRGLLSGMQHMIGRDIAHGDLHTDNVMITGGSVKIIDILLLSHGSRLSTGSLEARLRRDLLSLRLILQEVLQNVRELPGLARSFNDALEVAPSLEDLTSAFEMATSRRDDDALEGILTHTISQLEDDNFVEGDEYAQALAEQIPQDAYAKILEQMLDRALCRRVHRALVTLLWRGCSAAERETLARTVGSRIDKEVPKGSWSPTLSMLVAFGHEGWNLMPVTTRLRLESSIIRDVLNGYVDIYATVRLKGGALGTWSISFYSFFRQRAQLIENIAAMLDRSWYTQNYVGQFLMAALPRFATTDSERKRLIESLGRALKNDARLVAANLRKLPADWQSAATEAAEKD